MVKKLHIALSTNKIEATVKDYSVRLGIEPCSHVPDDFDLIHEYFLQFITMQ